MNAFSRRRFIQTSLIAAGATLTARSWAQAAGANSDIRIAAIGLNGRGRGNLTSLAAIPGVRITALCDVDSVVLERTAALPAMQRHSPKKYSDLREVLASNDVDAVMIATPNHWHSLAAIWALQAGKDVFVEKPVSHNIWEGRQLVAASKKYPRVVQSGTQIRSGEGLQEAVAWMRSGNLGKITAARGFCYKRRESLGKTEAPQPIPASLDYDLWSGPAPIIPPHRNTTRNGPIHYDWHWFWAYGNGDLGNQGVHQMDVARWFLGESGLPRHTLSIGGRLGYIDDGETPNTQIVIHDYTTAPLIFEVRGLPANTGDSAAPVMDKYRGVSVGNVIECEGGTIVVPSYFEAHAFDKDGKLIREFKGTDRLMTNFVDVVRSRKIDRLYAPIEEGHLSAALCHLGNISHRLGQIRSPEQIRDDIKTDSALAEAHGRLTEHLAANQIDFAKTPLTLGLPLKVDSVSERFTGTHADVANPLLTRQYRAPFVVPQIS